MTLVYLIAAFLWLCADSALLIYLYFQVGMSPVVGLILGSATLGVVLLRWQMKAVWRDFQQHLGNAKLPGQPATEGFLLFTAACLLIAPLPGLDGIGLLLMIAPFRRWLASRLRGWITKRFEPGPGSFVFQMGGIDSHGWPAPAYEETVAGTDSEDLPTLPASADGEINDFLQQTGNKEDMNLGASQDSDSIEAAEFRPVPSPPPTLK